MDRERTLYVTMSCITWAYVVVRAVLVPVTHDEALTFFTYVETGDFLPFRAHWDAGNHLLCTALAWCCYKLFGFQLWALRLPSVLAFVLFAAYAWKWSRLLNHTLVRWCLWAALLLMPFLIEFFSLFRGYALAIAFLSMGLFHLVAFVQHGGRAHLLGALGAWCCAAFAALSLITLWAFALVLMAFFVLRHERTTAGRITCALMIAVLGVAPWLFAYAYANGLNERGLLYYGNDLGFVRGSVGSLLFALFGRRDLWAAVSIAVILIGVLIVAIRERYRSSSTTRTALLLLVVLLVADVLLRAAMHVRNGTPYPEDRTLLQWLLLCVLAFVFAIDRLASAHRVWRYVSCALLLFPLRTAIIANADHTSYWPEEVLPTSVFDAVVQATSALGRPPTIGAYHQMPGCWAFGMRQHGLMLNAVDVAGFPHNDCELMLVEPLRDAPFPEGYHMIADAGSHRQLLLARDHPLRTRLLIDSMITRDMNDDEFTELWHPSSEQANGHRYLVQVDAVLNSNAAPLQVHLVSETNRANDKSHYEDVPLQFFRGEWHGDTLRTVRNVPFVPQDADRCVLYLWNEVRSNYSVAARLRVFIVEE